DFGLAKLIDSKATISVKGTPLYMSPEQWWPDGPHKVGPATDVYSLGAVLYQLFTGAPPFVIPSGNVFALGHLVLTTQPRKPSEVLPDLAPQFDALCLKALAKTPPERYASAKAFAGEIDHHRRRLEEAERRARAEADYQRGDDYYFGR